MLFVRIYLILFLIFTGFNLNLIASYKITLDTCLAKDVYNKVLSFIDKSINKNQNNNLDIIADSLKSKFKYLNNIIIKRDKSGNTDLIIKGVEPIYNLNQKYVLCENKHILPKELFDLKYINKLPHAVINLDLSLDANNLNLLKFKDFLLQLSPEVSANYSINWKNKNNIKLLSKKNKSINIITRSGKKITAKFLDACLKLAKNNSKKFCADIRFNKQVVVSVF